MDTQIDIRQVLFVVLLGYMVIGCAGKPAPSAMPAPDISIKAHETYSYEAPPRLTTNAVLQIAKQYVIDKKIRLDGYGEPVAYYNLSMVSLLKWTVVFESVPPIPDDNLFITIDDKSGTVTRHAFH